MINWDADHQHLLGTLKHWNCWRLLRLQRFKDTSVPHQQESKDREGNSCKICWFFRSILLGCDVDLWKVFTQPLLAMLTPEETSTHQIWDISEPFLQFELFRYFRMSCLRCEDCIQHNDSWGLNPTHPPCGPEKAMCFLHWQQLVSTTDTSVTNPSTKWIGQRLKLQMPVCMGLGCDVYPWGTGPDHTFPRKT